MVKLAQVLFFDETVYFRNLLVDMLVHVPDL